MAPLTRRRFLTGSALGVVALGCQRRWHAADQREVERVVAAARTRDGAGVALQRALGSAALPMLDPFLLLDEIHSDRREDWERGFPTHPHRGFETVSYLIAGAFEHRDSVGNQGVIAAGGVQWMTAGRGIVHSEMPRAEPGADLWGLQLWVNLPAARKMTAPRYQELGASDVVEVDLGDARARVVAGRVAGRRGPVEEIVVEPTMADVTLASAVRLALPGSHTAFAQVLDGEVRLGGRATPVGAGQLAVLTPGAELAASGRGRFLLLAAAPIGEPVARRGPFVMNTPAELEQAFADYRAGRLTDP